VSEAGSELALCSFRVGRGLYGIDVARVDQVLPRAVPLPLPGATPEIEGVLHLHGVRVPIVDLRKLLPRGQPPRGARPQVLVVRVGRRRIALRVDGLEAVRTHELQTVRPADSDAPRGVIAEVGPPEAPCFLLDLKLLLRRKGAPTRGQPGRPAR
jgi:purine-binding chemotaxis protein CheW